MVVGPTFIQTMDKRGEVPTLRKCALVVLAINILSAVLFIALVDRPVYDDYLHTFDLQNYATRGLSAASLLQHKNAPGPTAYLWMATGVHLLPGSELRNARIAILASWILLAAAFLVAARSSAFPEIWYGALLAVLVFPHSVQAAATLLTEGPALLFAACGVIAWIRFLPSAAKTTGPLALGILGGVSMGVATTCRQYYLALLPAAALFAGYHLLKLPAEQRLRSSLKVSFSLFAACVPVALLLLAWKNIASPEMVTGTAYHHTATALVGLNLSRPIVAGFYVAIYLLPFTFPDMVRLTGWRFRVAAVSAVLVGAAVSYFNSFFLQPGPFSSSIQMVSRARGTRLILFLFASIVIFNALAVLSFIWNRRVLLGSRPPVCFALLILVFFVAEQVGVGGNHPFYDRYVLQVAPFLGLIVFSLLPRLTLARVAVFLSLCCFSNYMLWRFAAAQ